MIIESLICQIIQKALVLLKMKQNESKRKISRYTDNNRRKNQRQNESHGKKIAWLEKRRLQRKGSKKNDSPEHREHLIHLLK